MSPSTPPPPSVVRPAVVYIMLFAAVGAYYPYLAVHFRDIGLSLATVGFLAALNAGVGLVAAPAWGAAADRIGAVRLPLVAAGVGAAVAAGWLGIARDPLVVALAVVLLAAGAAGLGPMLDSRTIELLGANRDRFGRARAWGSVAFIGAALFVGVLIDRTGPAGLFLVLVPTLLMTSLAAFVLLGSSSDRTSPGGRVRARFSSLDLLGLMRSRSLALFLVGSILVWSSVTALSTFLSIHLVSLGADGGLVGVVWALGALVEVPLMFAFPILAARLGAERLLVLGAVAFTVRAAGYALTPDLAALVAIAPIGGIGFALYYVGTVSYVARTVPASVQATAQGIFSGTAFSIGTIVGSVVGGQLAATITLRGMFAVSAIGTALAAVIVWWAIVSARGPSARGRSAGTASPPVIGEG